MKIDKLGKIVKKMQKCINGHKTCGKEAKHLFIQFLFLQRYNGKVFTYFFYFSFGTIERITGSN
jgi:hypothetical protein